MKLSVGTVLSSACLLVVAICSFPLQIVSQAQGGFVPFIEDPTSIVIQPDGKILVAGNTYFAQLLRLNADGTFDTAFRQNYPFWQETERSVALQPDGKILVGSLFGFGSGATNGVLRVNSNGTIDSSFGAQVTQINDGTTGGINSIGVMPNGQVLIAGQFSTVSGSTRLDIARLNSNGSVDAAFGNSQSDGEIMSMLLLADGKLVVGGTFNNIGGVSKIGIARINSDGTLDSLFATPQLSAAGDVHTISRQADGKYILAGSFTIADGPRTHTNVARLNSDGTLDSTFFIGDQDKQHLTVYSSLIQPDGKIVIGGGVNRFPPYGANDFTPQLAARFNTDGSRDNSLGNFPIVFDSILLCGVCSVALQPDGKIITGGYYRGRGRVPSDTSRINTNATLDIPYARFDYDGDARTDLSVFRPSNQTWYMLGSQTFRSFEFGVNSDLPVPADYDGDGKTDIGVFRQSNGTWYWINSSTITFSYLTWGEPGDLPVPGTILGRRKATYDVYRQSNKTHYRVELDNGIPDFEIWEVGGGFNPPLSEDVPMSGNYSNLFDSSIVLYRPSTSTFRRYVRGSGTVYPTQWGQPGDTPVSGDFDGDSLTDYAVYRPTTGMWSIRRSSDQGTMTRNWGEPGDIPLPADYDGDQRDDVAIFRPSTGQWFLWQSTEGISVQQFGADGDIPIPSSYLP